LKLSRHPFIVAIAVLLVAATGYAYWRYQAREDADGYITEDVVRGRIAATVTATGVVNPVTSVQVGTYVSGPIKAIYADYNSKVTKGQIVAKIDPASYQVKVRSSEAAVANAKAKLAKDRADLVLKKLTLERNRRLLDKKFVSQNDVDMAKSNYDQAVAQLALDQAAIQQAEADLEAARINLSYTDISSPVDGVVVSRSVDVGQTVAASFQTPTLFLIAKDLTKMQVDSNVSESDIGGVQIGQTVTFRVDAYPGKDFQGKIVQVRNAPTTVQNVVTYDVVVGVDNPNLELRPGMTATVTITTAERDDVLKVSLRALRFRPERPNAAPTPRADGKRQQPGREHGPSVWIVEPDGRLRRTKIEAGVRDDRYAEVVSGDLKEGDVLAVAYKRPETDTTATAQRPPPFGGGGGGGGARRAFR
jgi:HlyD family secretion protein